MINTIRPRVTPQQKRALDYLKKKERRILVIGDLHCPFEQEGYFEFCLETYDKFACNQVVFIGDLIDSHATSRHETDPNGYSAKTELELAIEDLQKWSATFPVADVIIGNHDRIVMRRAFSSSIPSVWIKSFNEVLVRRGIGRSALSTMAVTVRVTAKAALHAPRQRTTYKARFKVIYIRRPTSNIFAATPAAFGLCR